MEHTLKINLVAPDYSVSGQITEADLATIAADGFKTVICNRPDEEVEPSLHSRFIAAEAHRSGLGFVYNPVSKRGFTMANVDAQARAINAAGGPVFAYCRSGTRSTTCWALANVAALPVDAIIAAAAGAGYKLDALRPQLESMAADA